MKNFISIFCSFLSLLMLCSCNSYDTPTQAEFEEHSKKQGVVLVTDKTEYIYPEDTIRYNVVNYSEETYLFENDMAILEIYVNGKWEKVSFNGVHTYEAWSHELGLNEQSTLPLEKNLEEHERGRKETGIGNNRKRLKKGYYRIVRDGCVSNIFFIS